MTDIQQILLHALLGALVSALIVWAGGEWWLVPMFAVAFGAGRALDLLRARRAAQRRQAG